MRAARREEMGNEQEERQRNEISKINKGDIGSDGEQNNKEKERKKEKWHREEEWREISALRRTKTLRKHMSKKLCVYQISQLRKAETAVFPPQRSSSVVFQTHQQQLPA